MKTQDDKKLDNPVWFSLSETHQSFAVDYGSVKFYHPEYCPFGGFEKGTEIAKSIDEYSIMVDRFFIVGEKPELSNLLKLNKELVCLQMIVYNPIDIAINDPIVKLIDEHIDVLYELVNLVQPGYFKIKTSHCCEVLLPLLGSNQFRSPVVLRERNMINSSTIIF